MTTEFKDALDAYDTFNANGEYVCDLHDYTKGTIRRALKIAHRLMQDPSEGMIEAAQNSPFDSYQDDFETMRDQMLKEIDE